MNSEGLTKAKTMRSMYYPQYEFPEWVFKIWENLDFFSVVVYYNSTDDLSDVKQLVAEREPTNIGMNRLYEKKELQETFGWEVGYYQRYAEEHTFNKLPPNIAIYAKTPMKINKKVRLVNVINLIGYAFDSPKQPDRLHFEKFQLGKVELIRRYTNVWKYAFICAATHKLKNLHISAVGGGAFAPTEYSIGHGQKFKEEILKPSVANAQDEVDPKHKINLIWTEYPDFCVPDSFETMSQKEINKTLYVNAWDPLSMVGNGNAMDRSLDGAWGKSTALAPLCWSLSNPYMKYQGCKLDQ